MAGNSRIKEGSGVFWFRVFNVTFMLTLVFVMLYPLLYVLFASLSDGSELMRHTGMLLRPLKFNFASYQNVFKDPMIVRGYANTLFIVVVGVSLNMVMTCITAYALSRKRVYWQKLIMFYITITMVVRAGMIPHYITVGLVYGLEDSIWSLIIPSALSAFNLIIMRSAFSSIPDSLEESATLDGAGHLRILWSIILPLSLPTIAVIILYYAVGHWNSWFSAVLFMRDRSKFPLQLILREVLINNESRNMTVGTGDTEGLAETVKYAVIIIATVPILCVYPFLQKYFVKGTMVGAVKG